LIDDDVNIITV